MSIQLVPAIMAIIGSYLLVQVQLRITEAILERDHLHPLYQLITVMGHRQEFWTVGTVSLQLCHVVKQLMLACCASVG